MLKINLALLFSLCAATVYAVEPLTLDAALERALPHPDLGAAKANVQAEESAVSFTQWPSDPMFGVMYEQNMTNLQLERGPMTSLVFAQDIEFPAKYYFRGRIQQSKACQAKEGLTQAKLALRKRVITTYFQLYANQHIKDLINAQKDTVRQIARVAESRHSIGAVTQQDEMKAHVEQTAVENERFAIMQEEEALQAKLSSLLGDGTTERFSLPKDGLPLPELRLPENIAETALGQSRRVKQDEIRLQEAGLQKQLAIFDYAPDFRLSARTMVGADSPINNFAFTIDVSLPLWFFMRQNSEVSVASARSREAQYNLEKTKRDLISEAQEIAAKIRINNNLIKVFSTTLIPQAASTFNASRTAYQAGRTSFLELLDSARTIYTVRIAYYRHLAEYVEQLVLLEELVGTSLSSLPFGDTP